jgi:hypothetical protein
MRHKSAVCKYGRYAHCPSMIEAINYSNRKTTPTKFPTVRVQPKRLSRQLPRFPITIDSKSQPPLAKIPPRTVEPPCDKQTARTSLSPISALLAASENFPSSSALPPVESLWQKTSILVPAATLERLCELLNEADSILNNLLLQIPSGSLKQIKQNPADFSFQSQYFQPLQSTSATSASRTIIDEPIDLLSDDSN